MSKKFCSKGDNKMNILGKEIQNLIEGIKHEEWGYISKLNSMFTHYMNAVHKNLIEIEFGNEYESDFISIVEMKLIKGVHAFKGSTDNEFYAYMNTIIKNCALILLRDYIRPFHRLRASYEFSEDIIVTELEMESLEEYVVSKITSKEIYGYLPKDLSNEERKVILNTVIGEESVHEYAVRRNYKDVTIRAYKSKAVNKMKKDAKVHKLAEKYFIHY